MIRIIVKRDGRKVSFNEQKIANAIRKALVSVHPDEGATEADNELVEKLTAKVVSEIEKEEPKVPTVEHTQDLIEKKLIEEGLATEAKNFILYRQRRSNVRTYNTELTKIYRDLTSKSTADMDLKRENANIDANAPMGMMLRFGSEGSKDYVKRYVLRPEHALAHARGDIHIHDLDFYMLTINCCQIALKDLFKRGFSTGHGFLREPQTIQSAAALSCIAIQSNQNDMHGGQSIPMFEYDLAPYVARSYSKHLQKVIGITLRTDEELFADINDFCLDVYNKNNSCLTEKAQSTISDKIVSLVKEKTEKDLSSDELDYILKESLKLVERETYQAMEALIHNLNSMQSRAGAQVPFSSINYGTGTTPEQRMLIKNVLLATDAGLGGGETPIFPVQIFKVKDGINTKEGDVNYDLFRLACKVSAKRLFPNFEFIDAPFNIQYYQPGKPETEIAVMGCRTRVFSNVYDKTKEVIPGRGNLSFTSINLPRLGIEAGGSISKFFDSLDKLMYMIFDQLMDRFNIIAQKHVYNYPFLMGQGIWIDSDRLDPDDTIENIIKNGSMSVGFIGLAECLKALIGKHHGESKEAWDLGYKIIKHMREITDKHSEETGLNFSLFSTPAEGLSGRFIGMDQKIYGKIPGVTERSYYTNSFHIPVYFNISAQDKIRLEGPFHALCNAGAISYVEMDGDLTKNVDAFEKVILYMKECGIGYGSINHPVDRCPVCGYVGVINDECPRCGRHEGEGVSVEALRRLGINCGC